MFPFIANYGRELRMGADIRKRERIEKTKKFSKKEIKRYKKKLEQC